MFTAFENIYVLTLIMFVNGLAQGFGWPAAAKMLKNWFSPTELGTWWSILSSSMNIACSVGPIVATYLIGIYGWKSFFYIIGVFSVLLTLSTKFSLFDKPQDFGYKPIVKDQTTKQGRGSFKDLLTNRLMWIVGFCYMNIFLIRTAVLDWGQLFFIQDKKQSALVASSYVSSLEIGGFFGSIVAGYATDKAVSAYGKSTKFGSTRMIATLIGWIGTITFLHLTVFLVNKDSSQLLIWTLGLLLGAAVYCPINSYGVVVIEASPSHLSGTAHALVGFAANIGGVMAGLPLSSYAKYYAWTGSFILLEIIGVITIIICAIALRNVKYSTVNMKKKDE
ncbi:DgyrCDS14353 [Dimorphilus gyrociliatus]|nr:DgyrCDS14353 [Dimorphilus gyrociliatus]